MILYIGPVPKGIVPLWSITLTVSILWCVDVETVKNALCLHAQGDWGDVSEDERVRNNKALAGGGTLRSVHTDPYGAVFEIITEADRSITRVQLLDEEC